MKQIDNPRDQKSVINVTEDKKLTRQHTTSTDKKDLF